MLFICFCYMSSDAGFYKYYIFEVLYDGKIIDKVCINSDHSYTRGVYYYRITSIICDGE